MLKPDWLASLLSTALLDRLCGRQMGKSPPSLRYLIDNFINTRIRVDTDKENEESEKPAPSTPMKKLTIDSPKRPGAQRSPKIAVMKRNKYGEVPLHGHAKRGNLAKMRECLATPGVDVNVKCHAGYTPLHEAVAAESLAAVSLLLDHSAPRTVLHYFSPGNIKSGKVDLLQGDLEKGMNPVQEAVSLDNKELVSLFLGTVSTKPGFPSVKILLSATTKTGETMASLARSDSMKEVLSRLTSTFFCHCVNYIFLGRFSGSVSKPESLKTLNISNQEIFKVLLDQVHI